MFDVSWGEMFLIGAVALVVIGPKELPGVLRATGQGLAKLRRMAADFQYQFQQALQEAELDKVKDQVSGLTETAKAGFDPVGYARDQIKSAIDEVKPAGKPVDIGPPAAPEPVVDIPTPLSHPVSPETLAAQLAPKTEAEPTPAKAPRARKSAAAPVAAPAAGEAPKAKAAVAKTAKAAPKAAAKPKAEPKTKPAKADAPAAAAPVVAALPKSTARRGDATARPATRRASAKPKTNEGPNA